MQKFKGYDQLESIVMHLDSAELRDVYVQVPSTDGKIHVAKTKRFKAIYNIDRNRVEAIMSDKYTLVQHRDAFFPLLQAVQTIPAEIFGFVTDEGGKVYIDVLFDSEEYKIEPEDGKPINIGLRASNTYDGTGAFIVRAFGYRSYCDNGMVFGKKTIASAYQIHRGAVSLDVFRSILEELKKFVPMLKETINSAIQDSIEFAQVSEVLKALDIGKRTRINILSRTLTKTDKDGKISRWELYNTLTDYITHDLEKKKELTREKYHEKAELLLATPVQKLIGGNQ